MNDKELDEMIAKAAYISDSDVVRQFPIPEQGMEEIVMSEEINEMEMNIVKESVSGGKKKYLAAVGAFVFLAVGGVALAVTNQKQDVPDFASESTIEVPNEQAAHSLRYWSLEDATPVALSGSTFEDGSLAQLSIEYDNGIFLIYRGTPKGADDRVLDTEASSPKEALVAEEYPMDDAGNELDDEGVTNYSASWNEGDDFQIEVRVAAVGRGFEDDRIPMTREQFENSLASFQEKGSFDQLTDVPPIGSDHKHMPGGTEAAIEFNKEVVAAAVEASGK